jgi:hypothetical protein
MRRLPVGRFHTYKPFHPEWQQACVSKLMLRLFPSIISLTTLCKKTRLSPTNPPPEYWVPPSASNVTWGITSDLLIWKIYQLPSDNINDRQYKNLVHTIACFADIAMNKLGCFGCPCIVIMFPSKPVKIKPIWLWSFDMTFFSLSKSHIASFPSLTIVKSLMELVSMILGCQTISLYIPFRFLDEYNAPESWNIAHDTQSSCPPHTRTTYFVHASLVKENICQHVAYTDKLLLPLACLHPW